MHKPNAFAVFNVGCKEIAIVITPQKSNVLQHRRLSSSPQAANDRRGWARQRSRAGVILAVAIAISAGTPLAFAQTSSPPAQPGQGGMMGPGARPGMMMGRMGGMMPMAHGMGMRFEHVEGRLAFLKAELKITPEQAPQWGKFAEAYRAVAAKARERMQQMMQGGQAGADTAAATAPERLDRHERMLADHLDALRTIKAAFDPLYAVLGDEQKKTADQLIGSPMLPM